MMFLKMEIKFFSARTHLCPPNKLSLGVLQGSFLGYILFLRYIADLSSNAKFKHKSSADDCKIYMQVLLGTMVL